MSRYGKCQNFAGCLLAYRGEEAEVENDQPFICAECGKPLTEVSNPSSMWFRYLFAIGGVLIVGGGVFFAVPSLRQMVFKPHSDSHEKKGQEQTTNAVEPVVAENPPTTTDTGASTDPAAAEPPHFVTSPDRIDMDLSKQENKSVKAEVLTRVDLMPNVSSSNKDKLYNAVEKARSMGKILTVPFGSGKTELSPTDLEALKNQLEKPELAKLRAEPTAVFVILGYADPKGDPKKNIAISQTRADTVLKNMRDKLGVINVMHTIGMGGSKLLDAQNLEKNRIVEIWAVLP